MDKRHAMGVAVLCLGMAFGAAQAWAEKPTETLVGTIHSAEEYRGKVASVYFKTTHGEKFLLASNTEVGKELLKHVGDTVRATGYLKKVRFESEFSQVFDVLEFDVIPPVTAGSTAPVRRAAG